MARINVLDKDVAFYTKDDEDYICITDIARYKDEQRTNYLISNWLRNRNTIEFLGIWETINNPYFNPVEFDGFRKKAELKQSERLVKLNDTTISQMKILVRKKKVKQIEEK